MSECYNQTLLTVGTFEQCDDGNSRYVVLRVILWLLWAVCWPDFSHLDNPIFLLQKKYSTASGR